MHPESSPTARWYFGWNIVAAATVITLLTVGMVWAYLAHQVGAMISSWLGGWGYEHLGSHWLAFGLAAALLLLLAAGVVFTLPGSGRTLPSGVAGKTA